MSDTGPGSPPGWSRPEPTASTTGPGTSTAPASPGAAARRRRLLLIGLVAGAVVVIAVISAVVVSHSSKDVVALPSPTATTILLPVPTPTLAPVARANPTVFAAALPPALLQYALASSTPDPTWVTAGAIEAYSEAYSDGGTGKVVVLAGQWETAVAADAAAKQLLAAVPAAAPAPAGTASAGIASPSTAPTSLPESGNVTVAGQTVGTYSIRAAGDGTGIAIWTNGASVFQVTAPVADIHNVYAAYPL